MTRNLSEVIAHRSRSRHSPLIRGVTDKTGVSDRGTFLETPDASILENCPSQVGKAPELVPATKGEARDARKGGVSGD